MSSISLLVDGVTNKRMFFNELYNELGNELTFDISDDKIVVFNINKNKSEKLYDILAELFFKEYVKKSLIGVINKNYDYLTQNDKREVCGLAIKNILNDNIEDKSKLEFVRDKLKEFLLNSDILNVQGFINFRLNDLEYVIEDMVEESIQDYLLEIEYMEFINMLKFFVSVQKSKYNKAEVMYDDNIYIYGDGNDITEECIGYFEDDNVYCETIDDFLLNSLITIAPYKIIIIEKGKKISDDLKKTLLGVFENKIQIITK